MDEDAAVVTRTVLSRVAAILMTYQHNEVYTLTDIAASAGLPLSTAHRLVHELATWNLLRRNDVGGYGIGLPLRLLGAATRGVAGLTQRAAPVLQDLSQVLDAEVRLGVLGPGGVAHVESRRGSRPLTTFSGRPAQPAHATAMGKALLAFSPHTVVDSLLEHELTAYTPFTITAPDQLRRALATIRRTRFATVCRELEPDRSAVAVPVFAGGGRCAAAIEVRVDDPTRDVPTIHPILVTAACSLTRELRSAATVSPPVRDPAGAPLGHPRLQPRTATSGTSR